MTYKVYKDGSIYKITKQSTRKYYKKTTFNASDILQTYTVPSGVTSLIVDCVASRGGESGGKGGRIQCVLSVTAGQTLYVMVGSQDNAYNAADIRTNNAGITDETSLNSRLIVAGGGGWMGYSGIGGAGGGLTGATGSNSGDGYGGQGGTQSAGGSGGGHGNVFGYGGATGSLGLGANGAKTGGGGAGYYGGGSGGAGWYVYWEADRLGGGGGGSSFANSSKCSSVSHTQGYQDGNGYITLSYQSSSSSYDYYTENVTCKIFSV